ncbi:MAG: MFS transporter [Myxococcota bacterium]|nr:MFS transporter [Myxococcota bacterium]
MTSSAHQERSGLQFRLLFFLVFIFVGGYGNFFPLWLSERGFSEPDIGWLQGASYACLMIFPLVWARIADKRGDAIGVLRGLSLACFVTFIPAVLLPSVWPMMLALVIFYAFRVGIVPSTDAAALDHVGRTGEDYGRYRIWGSVGFIVGGFIVGLCVDRWSLQVVPWPLVVFLGLAVTLTLWMNASRGDGAEPGGSASAWSLLSRPDLRAFYGIHFLCRLSLQGLYLFLPLHLQALGISATWIPAYWTVGVVSEIILIRASPKLFKSWSPRSVIALCFFAAVLQYGLTAWTTHHLVLLGVMTLHGLAFGIWYVTSISWLGEHVPSSQRASAQALFQAVGFGFGGMISSVAAGYIYEAWQGPGLFAVAAAGCVVTLGAHLLWFPRSSRDSVTLGG